MAESPEIKTGYGTGRPDPIDVHVGGRVRLRRTMLAMSQEKLGDAIGLTFQQVQKYERGANRIGASRLFAIARVLDTPVSFFFDGMPPEIAGGTSPGLSEAAATPYDAPAPADNTADLVRAYYQVADATARKRLFELAKSLAGTKRE